MNSNEMVERALASARELQRAMGDALSKNVEQMKPVIEQALKNAQALQTTLTKHAQDAGVLNQEQAKQALGHLQEFVRIGSEAAKASVAQARDYASQMAEQSRKAAESFAEAIRKGGGNR
jgi:uncharacterized protein with von Willebrand factor type A (vWA) domain